MKKVNKRFLKAIETLCSRTSVSYEQLCAKKPKRDVSIVAQLFMTALYNKGYKLRQCGAPLGRDHSAVIYSVRTFSNLIETYAEKKQKYEPIYNEIFKLIPEIGPLRKERVYMCGQTTGLEFEDVVSNFKKERKQLRRARYVNIVDPTTTTTYLENNYETNKKCFFMLLSCKFIYVMKGANDCEQAKLELDVARNIGLKVITIQDLLY